jgi:hypothetical protein
MASWIWIKETVHDDSVLPDTEGLTTISNIPFTPFMPAWQLIHYRVAAQSGLATL